MASFSDTRNTRKRHTTTHSNSLLLLFFTLDTGLMVGIVIFTKMCKTTDAYDRQYRVIKVTIGHINRTTDTQL